MLGARTIAVFALIASGCSFDRADHAQACESDRDCEVEARCHEGFCIERDTAAPGCAQSSRIESCYEGVPADTLDVGSCKAGQRICVEGESSECLGQVLPDDEICNGKDDDCDGKLDEIAAASTCDTHLSGACREGALLCRDGIKFCQATQESQTESCNAVDDDCDGMTDEVSGTVCYPTQTAGCSLDARGVWQCNGQCATGQTSCAGSDERCSGAITPTEERCTTGTMLAQDEDCDGAIDESCPCGSGDSRDCYAGPLGTRGFGVCKAGRQECVSTEWGDCTGQTLPSPETCANPGYDDDCNDVVDDVPGVGSTCVALGEKGICRDGTLDCTGDGEPECLAGEAADEELCDELDQDCDGDATNGFDFNSDATCGSCDVKCSAAETCCGGVCLEVAALQVDPDNCGACGRACGFGQYCCQGDCLSATGGSMMMAACACDSACGDKSCCGSNCRDLEKDKNNCGACGRKCGPDETCRNGTCARSPTP
jgi:hypothetical protein